MARARVSSFMTTFGYKSTSSSPYPQSQEKIQPDSVAFSSHQFSASPIRTPPAPSAEPRTARRGRSASAATSMPYKNSNNYNNNNATTTNGTTTTLNTDALHTTPPEMLPIFSFLNSHANKLYQEGYFLRLNDLDIAGRPNVDRNWTECFAQLVGTVLSLWDAAALDAAGQNGEVAPTFINLVDGSIKMIETLPTRNQDVEPLQNVLSISTAGKNRYLLHFNSFHSMMQWTAGIRLAMFEHTSLQELYTGSLVAGKGKGLNNIRVIMERSRYRSEDWARVRFGAGTPWRRCWYVIDPPNEKEFQKEQKSLKKRSAYERPSPPRGDIKFYDSKKTKKVTPIATITDAYSAYAIYPQSKPLIDQSTLVKVEGRITIHSNPESTTEGFVFVMPEVHPAVSGFEMMLRWLFPVYDTFGLYGRPSRLVADTIDSRGLMFAMPQERRYGYLDIQDVAALVCKDDSQSWSEQEWRRQLKDATAKRLSNGSTSRAPTRQGSRVGNRASLPASTTLRYEDGASIRSTPSQRRTYNQSTDAVFARPQKNPTSPPPGSLTSATYHARSVSDTLAFSSPSPPRKRPEPARPSRLSMDQDVESPSRPPPLPPSPGRRAVSGPERPGSSGPPSPREGWDHEPGRPMMPDADEVGSELRPQPPPTPVAEPPAFLHSPGQTPSMRPDASPELRKANSRMSVTTLSQLVDASRSRGTPNGGLATAGATAAWRGNENIRNPDQTYPGTNEISSRGEYPGDSRSRHQGLAIGINPDVDSADPSVAQSPQGRSQRPRDRVRPNPDNSVPRKSLPVRAAFHPEL